MDDVDSWLLIAFLACIALSGFFSSAESAFVAMPNLRIRYLVDSGVKGAAELMRMTERPERFLSTVLLGNNLVNVAAATLGTILAVAVFGLPWGPVIATVGVTTLVLVFGEVIPKTVAVHHAQRLSLGYVYPVKAVQYALFPFVLALGRIGLGFTRIVSDSEESKKLVSEGEIRSVINVGESEGVVEQDEAQMLHKVFEFTDRPASKIMVPRTEIAWVAQGMTVRDFLDMFEATPYSRFPVYKDNTDNVVGILFAKDVLKRMRDAGADDDMPIDDLVRPAHYVPESKRLGELLAEMRDLGYHTVMVVDEYGGVTGMVTLGQLMEEIVGDIRDELTGEEKDFVVTGHNIYEVDGGFRVEDANEELGLGLPAGDYDTVAGFILSRLGRIPKRGEQLKYQDLEFTVTDMRGMKIEKVMVTKET